LTPTQESQTLAAARANENWDELTRLGQEIATEWPQGVSSGDVLSQMRHE